MASVLLNWNEASSKESIKRYLIYKDDLLKYSTNVGIETFVDNDVFVGFTYSYYIIAETNLNRFSEKSNVATITIFSGDGNVLNFNLNNYL